MTLWMKQRKLQSKEIGNYSVASNCEGTEQSQRLIHIEHLQEIAGVYYVPHIPI